MGSPSAFFPEGHHNLNALQQTIYIDYMGLWLWLEVQDWGHLRKRLAITGLGVESSRVLKSRSSRKELCSICVVKRIAGVRNKEIQ